MGLDDGFNILMFNINLFTLVIFFKNGPSMINILDAILQLFYIFVKSL